MSWQTNIFKNKQITQQTGHTQSISPQIQSKPLPWLSTQRRDSFLLHTVSSLNVYKVKLTEQTNSATNCFSASFILSSASCIISISSVSPSSFFFMISFLFRQYGYNNIQLLLSFLFCRVFRLELIWNEKTYDAARQHIIQMVPINNEYQNKQYIKDVKPGVDVLSTSSFSSSSPAVFSSSSSSSPSSSSSSEPVSEFFNCSCA